MKKFYIFLVLMTSPMMILAAAGDNEGISGVVDKLGDLLGVVYTLILAAIGVAFAWGVLKFVFKSGTDQEEGKSMMIWSLVAITILASVYGIVKIFQETVGVGTTNSSEVFKGGLPKIQSSS